VTRDDALQIIEHTSSEEDILRALHDYLVDPANGHDARLAEQLRGPIEVAAIAYELTRLRLAPATQASVSEELEAMFARASMRIAQILDRTGGWEAYRIRAGGPTATPMRDARDWVEPESENGSQR
jgi:hypothetical protein